MASVTLLAFSLASVMVLIPVLKSAIILVLDSFVQIGADGSRRASCRTRLCQAVSNRGTYADEQHSQAFPTVNARIPAVRTTASLRSFSMHHAVLVTWVKTLNTDAYGAGYSRQWRIRLGSDHVESRCCSSCGAMI
ncbi:uncharacterized protein EV420DRAFT_250520 [Desarmillaria tabescens]|uniref:Uncharacterized protein n=1 Tax=Armillaria tabescens TaxID=1929756 RepID=A0AA39KFD8_ARMTA|nr:uncharacterized protein EV420DRAFT_250520 [Desarmillaria tabescens]KAK0460090.1 hypothetical protein EV420DRAFT_250520 [Desarmillaria tabescens]